MTDATSRHNRSDSSSDRFFELAIDPLCVINRNGYIARANPALIDLLGYTSDELLTLHVSAIIDPEDEKAAIRLLQSTSTAEPLTSLELRCRHKDGSDRIIAWNIQPDPLDGSLFASGRDITESRAAERSLHESRERLRLASKAVDLHTWEADVVGEELRWSRDNPQLVDVPLPRTFAEFHVALHEEDRDRVIDSLRHAIATEGEFRFEYRFANQSPVDATWLLSAGIAIRDPDTHQMRIVGITQDVTSRVRSQHQSELLATIGSDFSSLTSTTSILRAATERTLRFFGGSGATIVEVDESDDSISALYDCRLQDMEIPETWRLSQFLSESMLKSLKNGEVVAITDIHSDPHTESLSQVYAQWGIKALLIAPSTRDGTLETMIVLQRNERTTWQREENDLLREIAYRIGVRIARARSEEALRESEARYRYLFTSIDEGFCVLERVEGGGKEPIDFHYLTANPASSTQTGVDDVVGKTIREVFPSEPESWYQTFDAVLHTREPVRFVHDLDSTERVLELYAFPLDDDANRRLGLIFQDITARAQAGTLLEEKRREAEDAVHARDVFLSIASHELRNPVASIKGAAQLLRRSFVRGRLDAERTDRLTSALVESGDRLALLLDDLLDVSRLQSGQMRIIRQPTDLGKLITDIIAEEYASLDHHSIESELSAGNSVLIDQERIRQVLRNLFDNAIKYSPEGGEIEVSARYDDEAAHVVVKDPGIGLPPAMVESVFQPFGRAPNAAESNIPGMGLGLYICRNIALAHGGWLAVESEGENLGLSVHLTLPYSGNAQDP